MDDIIKVPYIKDSAVISLSFGSAFITNIQASLSAMVEGMTTEERDALTARIEAREQLSGRDLVIYTLSVISMNLLKEAERLGQVEYKDLQSSLGL